MCSGRAALTLTVIRLVPATGAWRNWDMSWTRARRSFGRPPSPPLFSRPVGSAIGPSLKSLFPAESVLPAFGVQPIAPTPVGQTDVAHQGVGVVDQNQA